MEPYRAGADPAFEEWATRQGYSHLLPSPAQTRMSLHWADHWAQRRQHPYGGPGEDGGMPGGMSGGASARPSSEQSTRTLDPREALRMAHGDHAMAFGAMCGHAQAAMVPPGGFRDGSSPGFNYGYGYSLGRALGDSRAENEPPRPVQMPPAYVRRAPHAQQQVEQVRAHLVPSIGSQHETALREAERRVAQRREAERREVQRREAVPRLVQTPTPAPVPLAELVAATAGWAAARKVGEGGFGAVYRADALPSRPMLGPVAIKRLGADSQQGLNELMSEVQLLGTCRHEHLLPLLAFCYEGGVGCLVYPLMAGGSLEDRLVRDDDASRRLASLLPAAGAVRPPLTWQQRLRAVRDATRALVFLHTPTATRPVVLHRDIKPANVLLDLEGNAKLADVGLAKQAHEMQGGRTHLTTRNLAGTNGYIDPLYADSGQYSQTTDAYAMGVTLLVALSGRPALQAKDAADDALEDLTDGAALQRALDPAAGWPEPAAAELLRVVKGLYWERRQQRRMSLASALEMVERVCEDQGVRPGMAELAADANAPRMCVICMDAPRTTRFRPCGHSQCCEACAAQVIRRGGGASRCPYCRTSITTMVTDPNITNEATFVGLS